jgi:hypothetical protein
MEEMFTTRWKKTIGAIPFLIICGMVSYAWFEFTTTDYASTWRQIVALILVLGNAGLYFVRYKQALLLTGLILIAATLNLLAFSSTIVTDRLFIFGIGTPPVQGWSLLLLVIYFGVNYYALINWYLDWREETQRKN